MLAKVPDIANKHQYTWIVSVLKKNFPVQFYKIILFGDAVLVSMTGNSTWPGMFSRGMKTINFIVKVDSAQRSKTFFFSCSAFGSSVDINSMLYMLKKRKEIPCFVIVFF